MVGGAAQKAQNGSTWYCFGLRARTMAASYRTQRTPKYRHYRPIKSGRRQAGGEYDSNASWENEQRQAFAALKEAGVEQLRRSLPACQIDCD